LLALWQLFFSHSWQHGSCRFEPKVPSGGEAHCWPGFREAEERWAHFTESLLADRLCLLFTVLLGALLLGVALLRTALLVGRGRQSWLMVWLSAEVFWVPGS